jgi:hypothetical protein
MTYRYLEDEVATTIISCRTAGSEIVVRIGGRQGTYEGMPVARTFDLRIYSEQAPSAVYLNGKGLPEEGGWNFDNGYIRLRVGEDSTREPVEIRFANSQG